MIDAGFSFRSMVPVTALVALTVGAFSMTGCAHDARPLAPVQAQGATAGLRVYVKAFSNADATSLVKSYTAALRWAGFELVTREKDAELVAELRLRVEDAGPFVAGAEDDKVAQVELVMKGNNVDLGAASVEYDYNEPIPVEELSRLTLAVTTSEALDSYALQIQQRDLATANRSIEL